MLSQKGYRILRSSGSDLSDGKDRILASVPVMIVEASRPINLGTTSIRNEWMYYLQLMEKEIRNSGQSKRKLICYLLGGMSPNMLPRGLAAATLVIEGESERLYTLLQSVLQK